MPRSMWEPWLVFRKPLEGRVQDNLRRWRTGGFRRPSPDRPFGDVIRSSPTRKEERNLAPHPSLKPQGFLRQLVRGVLPFGEGIVLDPFCGAGSTLAAAEAVGYRSVGIESGPEYFDMACHAIPGLAVYRREPADADGVEGAKPGRGARTGAHARIGAQRHGVASGTKCRTVQPAALSYSILWTWRRPFGR